MKKLKLTSNIKYAVIDYTLYLFISNDNIKENEKKLAEKKMVNIIEKNEISYINISGKHLEKHKDKLYDIGFNMSYYDINKLNYIYNKVKDKKAYRTYGIITKKDFYESVMKKEEQCFKQVENTFEKGYINNMLLLFVGIIMLCFFVVLGAIDLVR